MLFLQGVYSYTAWKNSSFCTVLRYKMLLLQAVHVCTPWSNSFLHGFAPQKCYYYSAYINVGTRGIAFARVLHGLPMPAPAHLIGSPNPLVSRAPQKGAEQAPGISPQPAHARSGKLECRAGRSRVPGASAACDPPPREYHAPGLAHSALHGRTWFAHSIASPAAVSALQLTHAHGRRACVFFSLADTFAKKSVW